MSYYALNSFILTSCKKTDEYLAKEIKASDQNSFAQNATANLSSDPNATCFEPLEPDGFDSIPVPTILGAQLVNNPYSVANMQQASLNLYGHANGIAINKKYFRFKPTNEEQLKQLADADLEVSDYPLDYEVLQLGDYYDQGTPTEEIPWFYAVVEPNASLPASIPFEHLADLYVPDDDIYLENEAFRITSNPVDLDCDAPPQRKGNGDTEMFDSGICLEQACPEPNVWDPNECACVPPACPIGSYWDVMTQQCVPNLPPTPPSTKKPAGQILVRDNSLNGGFNGGDPVAVRRTRVVLRRYFKEDRVFTNDNGNFTSNKHFNNKVNVVVKFKSTGHFVSGVRGIRFNQMYFPIRYSIGKYKGNLSNVLYIFEPDGNTRKRRHRNWWAAQYMNAHLEYIAHATALQTGTIPNNMCVLLSNYGSASGAGSAPMNRHRAYAGAQPHEWIRFFAADPARSVAVAVFNFLAQGIFLRTIDITLGYNTETAQRSDEIKALMYHELSHAAHFERVGQQWWNNFVYAEELTILRWNEPFDPYGDGSDGVASEYISLGESWAEHLALVMADRQYGNNSTGYSKQGIRYLNDFPIAGFTSHINALEDYSPDRLSDPFRWIPEGIYYDLFDLRNEIAPLTDRVSGFTNQQLFNALESDVRSMPEYRQRLILQNPGNQTQDIINLFNEYHY